MPLVAAQKMTSRKVRVGPLRDIRTNTALKFAEHMFERSQQANCRALRVRQLSFFFTPAANTSSRGTRRASPRVRSRPGRTNALARRAALAEGLCAPRHRVIRGYGLRPDFGIGRLWHNRSCLVERQRRITVAVGLRREGLRCAAASGRQKSKAHRFIAKHSTTPQKRVAERQQLT